MLHSLSLLSRYVETHSMRLMRSKCILAAFIKCFSVLVFANMFTWHSEHEPLTNWLRNLSICCHLLLSLLNFGNLPVWIAPYIGRKLQTTWVNIETAISLIFHSNSRSLYLSPKFIYFVVNCMVFHADSNKLRNKRKYVISILRRCDTFFRHNNESFV